MKCDGSLLVNFHLFYRSIYALSIGQVAPGNASLHRRATHNNVVDRDAVVARSGEMLFQTFL